MNNKVIWKDVASYEKIYEVSNTGLVRTHSEKTTYSKRHGIRKWKQRVLKNKNSSGRDCRVTLWKDGKSKDFLVHRIVAEAFLTKTEGKEYINHIDGNPKNNHVSNLEWCDHFENNNHAFDNDLIKTGKKVILLNTETLEVHKFRSLSKASEFLGRDFRFLSKKIKEGESIVNGYEVYLKAN
ncbi:MAG: HNH endonuclease [Solibacillus sp.]|uniref:NUMOD4 domain-containing protein n=1 Tax=Solibacillus sp. TaxID=1909654 RepID=UPI003314867B